MQYRDSSGPTFTGRSAAFNSRSTQPQHDDSLFKRHTIVKERDIEDLGNKAAASRSNNDESSKYLPPSHLSVSLRTYNRSVQCNRRSGWATASGDVDYTVKLVFSDDEGDSGSKSESKPPSGRSQDDRPRLEPGQAGTKLVNKPLQRPNQPPADQANSRNESKLPPPARSSQVSSNRSPDIPAVYVHRTTGHTIRRYTIGCSSLGRRGHRSSTRPPT